MKFVYWNVKQQALVHEVSELIVETNCDIVAFAEMDDSTCDQIHHNLIENMAIDCALIPTPGCDRIKIFTIGQSAQVWLLNQDRYHSLLKVNETGNEFIVGFVHFPSKLHHSLDQLRRVSEKLCLQLVQEETNHSNLKALIMGDFNSDPFESPMVSFTGMGATNGVDCSQRGEVTRDGEKRRLFYNPMWTLYSTYKDRPGSHNYSRLGEDVVSWHFLDQVLIRPELIANFNFDSLKLISRTTNYDYLNRNQKPKLSDHLPLMCELSFTGGAHGTI